MKLYLGSNRILGGGCSITFGPSVSVRMSSADDDLRFLLDVYGADGSHVATCQDGRWSDVDSTAVAVADGTTVALSRDGQLLLRLLIRPRFAKLVHADFYGPGGEHVMIGTDGALRLLDADGVAQLEVADCEFLGEANFAAVEAGAIGDANTLLHGSGISYTADAVGQVIVHSEFAPSDASAAMAAAGMSLN